jgi:hypothetical protein
MKTTRIIVSSRSMRRDRARNEFTNRELEPHQPEHHHRRLEPVFEPPEQLEPLAPELRRIARTFWSAASGLAPSTTDVGRPCSSRSIG